MVTQIVEQPGLISRLQTSSEVRNEIPGILLRLAKSNRRSAFEIMEMLRVSHNGVYACLVSEIADFVNSNRVFSIRIALDDYQSDECSLLLKWLKRYANALYN